ncbi:hypothetical protein [Mesobacillus campisalis]|nr:hypothetical protein [Mesobacillus campisalis]
MKKRYLPKRRMKGLCIRGYRYCGPRCSGPGSPVNAVDACCKAHDECLNGSESRCRCDRRLIDCLRSHVDKLGEEGRTARLISNYMKLQTLVTCSFCNHK